MNLAIASYKGGVGKTSLSFSIAKDLNFQYITNDSSIATKFYEKAKYIPKNLPFQDYTVYDFGGFQSEYIVPILKFVDFVIVPTIFDSNSILKSIQIIKEVKKISPEKEIIVIANMIESKDEYKKLKEKLTTMFPDIKIFKIRRSKLFRNALEGGVSIEELYYSNSRTKYMYRNSFKDYQKVIEFLKEKVKTIGDNKILLKKSNGSLKLVAENGENIHITEANEQNKRAYRVF